MFSSVKKRVNKPLPKLYPQSLETIGDHLRTKRLDLGFRQKDLENIVGVCQSTIKNWEKNYTTPQPQHIPLICNFLQYCPLIEPAVDHFGHQLRYYRIFTQGKSIFESAIDIGIDEGTLNEIEQSNTIRHTHVFNSINKFLKAIYWQIPNSAKAKFIPSRAKCNKPPKFNAPIDLPETLGQHIALKRKQLKLTQVKVMAKIGVISPCAYRSWERYGGSPHIKYYPKIMEFLGYCPIKYCKSKGHQLKLMREYSGLSCRQIDKLLKLSKGCTYRAETGNNINTEIAIKLKNFYKMKIE